MVHKIALDVDGVLADLVHGMATQFGRDYGELLVNWPKGCYEIHQVFGLTKHEMWSGLSEAFWSNLPLTWFARDLVNHLSDFDVFLLTSPIRDARCLSGKYKWICHQFPQFARKFLIGPSKYHCAKPRTILIDDCDANVVKFMAEGGDAVVVPTLHNREWAYALDPVSYVMHHLERKLKCT